MDSNKFYINVGTVQCFIARDHPFYMRHFGMAEYDRNKPILSDNRRSQAQPIVDALNNNTMTIEEAEKQLDRIY